MLPSMLILSLLSSAALTFLVERAARRKGVLDVPNSRSSHTVPTPRGGGVAIVIAICLALGTGALYSGMQAHVLLAFSAGLPVALVGCWDDLKGLPASLRLGVHCLAAAGVLVALGGMPAVDLGFSFPYWSAAGAVAGVMGLVWTINLTNFMDGIDGLAGSEMCFVCAAGGTLLMLEHEPALAFIGFSVAAACCGFLLRNWPPARIFMGDAGSGFLGFTTGTLILLHLHRHPQALWPWLILFGVFVVDATLTLLQRARHGARLHEAHRTHAYQHLAREFGHRKVTVGVLMVNLFWLAPLAGLAWMCPRFGLALLALAYFPLVWLAARCGAGREVSPNFAVDRNSMTRFLFYPGVQPIVRCFVRFRRPLVAAFQLSLFLLAGLTAFLLRFEFSIPHEQFSHLTSALVIWALVKISVFHLFGTDHSGWRYTGMPDLVRLALGNLAATLLSGTVIMAFAAPGFPRSLYALDFLICLLFTGGARMLVRLAFEFARLHSTGSRKRVLIYGAGRAGATLAREIQNNPRLDYEVVGYVDDNADKTGLMIRRARVFGTGAELPAIVRDHSVEMVLIAAPTASGHQMSEILRSCEQAGVTYKTVPGMAEIIESSGLVSQIRDVAVEDVLGRSAVVLDHERISSKLRGRVALVTGAAGSIGSELCRQIARFQPETLVAFEIAESALFDLEQEMHRTFPSLHFCPEIGSIQNVQRLREVFEMYRPAVIYHAAAYKHVPLMETHVFEAVENNVVGTFNVATVASDCEVEDFVMISSDKAVRPTNMMGATKRVTELVIRSLQNGGPRFVSVRFGNVLGSNGSVIPIFKRQIASGGPVTVTHPDMRRYFMTIPEAAQLVLQASTMGKGGEIFELDMGKPVRIVDLARQLIRLSGLKPDEDIKIEFSGIRPGEKLFEELNADSETALPTYHEKIRIFAGTCLAPGQALRHLAALRAACERRNLAALVLEIKSMVPDYNPSRELLEKMVTPGLGQLANAVSAASNPQLSALVPQGAPE